MNQFINRLLRVSLSAGLSDRERFVERVSTLISERMKTNPEQSQAIGEELVNVMASLHEDMIFKEILKQNSAETAHNIDHTELIAELRKLNDSIQKLNETLQKVEK